MDFNLFNKEYNNKIHKEWENLINNRPVTPGVLRPEVLDAWKFCISKGIDPYRNPQDDFELIPKEASIELSIKNKLMCDVALPFMEDLYRNIPGPDSFVILFDKNCIPLARISSNEAHNPICVRHKHPQNLYGEIIDTIICQKYKKPYFCYGEEHFNAYSKNSLCSSAPIFNDNNELIGILTISIDISNGHWHTMGMILSATRAIENEIRLHKANENTANTANQLAAAIESVSQGMFIVDSENVIRHVNSYAKKILFMKNKDIKDKKVYEILKDANDTFKNPISFMPEQEIILNTPKGNMRYFISVKKFSSSSDIGEDCTLIILKEHDYAKTLSNNVTNSYSRFSFDDIAGKSKALSDTISMAKIAARSTSTVLITGPSGTGKELFAHSIHSASERCNGPFISVNCGALPSGLVESELFGYERGAFTGAKKEGQTGKFELANHGTIFLDEIGEMPLSVQASVLRVLESKEVTRIGGNNTNILDVRIIAATNKNLLQAIRDKEFREDLYYRLNVLRIKIPSLKERKEDIPVLAERFLETYAKRLCKGNLALSEDAYELLKQYDYPGNVRELENIIERAVNICEPNAVIGTDILKFFISLDDMAFSEIPSVSSEKILSAEETSLGHTIKDVEKKLIEDTLISTNGSITKTAELTGIGRRTLYRKFDEYGMDYTKYRKK